jgi:TPR repeat protein
MDSSSPTGIVEMLETLVKPGNAEAIFLTGKCFDNGASVPENDAEAVKYYKLGAEKGHGVAANNLAIMYLEGHRREKESPHGVLLAEKIRVRRI